MTRPVASPHGPGRHGGIDLGGTKIEAGVFDDAFALVAIRRWPTPTADYETLLDALDGAVRWIDSVSGSNRTSIGVGVPGLCEPGTGVSYTANLPASGRMLRDDLARRAGRRVAFENDCKCFAVSEANGGAGEGHRCVFGLIIGTGVGGGVCIDGALLPGPNALAGEIGHVGVPARTLDEVELPLRRCACGLSGCFEAYVAGPGLAWLGERAGARANSARDLADSASLGRPEAVRAMSTWRRLVGELLFTVQLAVDPHCIVLGGGLSRLERVTEALRDGPRLPRTAGAPVSVARHGDSSGTRGAAILGAVAPGGRASVDAGRGG